MLHFVRVEALNVQISKLSLSLRVGVWTGQPEGDETDKGEVPTETKLQGT